jgi:hypothetical protein
MKDKILSINLETQTAPIIQEVQGKEYIEYGTEEWRNLYPQFLIDLYYNSSTHAAIINTTAELIAGEELVCEDKDTDLDAYVELKKFFRHANGKETLHQVVKKLAFDFKLQGAYAIHIIWNQERTKIVEVYHVPVERVRAGIPNNLGQIDTYYISSNWANERENPPTEIAAFNTNDRTATSQLLYTGAYSPNMDCYHTPDYIAANNWALVDQRVAEFHLNNIENGFSGSYFISFANGVPTQEERFQIEQSLTDKFTGARNSGKFILTFSDDKTRTPDITPIAVSKVGMIDGKPVFNTIEEAIKNAKALGCEGYHEHELEGKTVYMACEGHTEATELDKFIEEFGEDKPEDWELIDEEIVDGEHQDFDFEQVLNEVANDKTELASTGTARPNARSSQDGVNKDYNEFYKVRYVYTKDNFLSQEGSTRDFCSIMTSADKIYRKEDIISMGNKAVNAGWGERGAATYSIWLYKGGGNCHHFWLRQIYKTSLRGAKDNISSSQLISYTKARSEGFTAEQNDTLVAKPPKRMTNNGFLEPR